MTVTLETNVLIIGAGIAGGTAALQLADSGVPVTLITNAPNPHESNTYYAQGGIIYRGVDDSPGKLAADIMHAGAHHNNPDSVNILAQQGPELLEQILLERINTDFDRHGDTFSLIREAGHSLARIIHATDITGQTIATALIAVLCEHPNVTLLSHHTAIDLIMSEDGCTGAFLLDQCNAQITTMLAQHTILATGGLGQIYKRTTNPEGARGDGLAMAYRAGARLADLEFIQFHPTALVHPNSDAYLISESVRGAGARLVDASGTPFMQHYAPEWKDLAPRDVVARSIYREMQMRDAPHMYLDVKSYVSQAEIRDHFPNIQQQCLEYGIDLRHDLVPVAPAAHYSCGGVAVDAWGQTSVNHLYAVGEVACTGLHGANRLASTSLLEGLVWGYRTAEHILQQGNARNLRDLALLASHTATDRPLPQFERKQQHIIQSVMWNVVGLVRTTDELRRAMQTLTFMHTNIEGTYRSSPISDELVGLRNIAQVALLVTRAALQNTQSLGCHYRVSDDRAAHIQYSTSNHQRGDHAGYNGTPRRDYQTVEAVHKSYHRGGTGPTA